MPEWLDERRRQQRAAEMIEAFDRLIEMLAIISIPIIGALVFW